MGSNKLTAETQSTQRGRRELQIRKLAGRITRGESLQRSLIAIFSFALVLFISSVQLSAQTSKPSPTPTPEPKTESQDQIRVFTEEVRLPVSATDAQGRYDPALEVDDVLVLEDGVAQTVRSVRHIPANVLFILDTGGDANGLSGLSKKTSTTRAVALRIVARLREGDRLAVLQFTIESRCCNPGPMMSIRSFAC
jgi:hypothetical protein